MQNNLPPVLDVCCSTRMFWFNKHDSRVIYLDIRKETVVQNQPKINHQRVCEVSPDYISDFTNLPFESDTFALVVFDPPHIVSNSKDGTLGKFYGTLTGDWREMIRAGFSECFRVLRPEGVLVFKWNEISIPVEDILKLTPHQPLFGHPTRRGALPRKGKPNATGTHWMTFMKPNKACSGQEPLAERLAGFE